MKYILNDEAEDKNFIIYGKTTAEIITKVVEYLSKHYEDLEYDFISFLSGRDINLLRLDNLEEL